MRYGIIEINSFSMRARLTLSLLTLLLLPGFVYAHPGNTDASGCHTCRTNCPKWGLSRNEYHCHRSKGLPQPLEPIRSHADGTTEPWPEYKNPSTGGTISPSPSFNTQNIAPQPATAITYTLRKGMVNSQVTKLQQILARDPSIYPEGLVTGYFGTATERAVKRFQKKYGIEQVGYVGPRTRTLLSLQ